MPIHDHSGPETTVYGLNDDRTAPNDYQCAVIPAEQSREREHHTATFCTFFLIGKQRFSRLAAYYRVGQCNFVCHYSWDVVAVVLRWQWSLHCVPTFPHRDLAAASQFLL